MEVIFAKNIGFCFGAKRAIEILNKSLKEDPKPIFVLGKILHNKKVIQDFKKRGAKFVNSLKKINSGT
ncbi:4-hydroxy-3-methylbut-2-enyl diphosphate reductase, partial [Candidatus Parcubacteria bacterium]|nr:4-hydroxy-3-methylbut-2-enyl diphosphate reductase [Candidatus Parcubacteria bacterium]